MLRKLAALALAIAATAPAAVDAQNAPTGILVGGYASRHAGDTFLTITAVVALPVPMKPTAATIAIVDARGVSQTPWKAPATALRKSALTTTFLMPPGRYTVRATITEGARRPVTVEGAVVAALTPIAAGLSVSEITVGASDTPFCPQPALTATASGIARFELYGGKTGMPVSIVAELATDAGATVQRLTPKVTGTPEPDRFVVNLPLDLRALQAGSYTIRVTMGVDGQPTTTVTHTFLVRPAVPGTT